MPFPSVKLLVIEDNPGDFILLESLLYDTKINTQNIKHVPSLSDATNYLNKNEVDLILLDLSLPDGFGLNSYEKIIAFEKDAAVIILSGSCD
jgi:two-component system cell cycle response regulator